MFQGPYMETSPPWHAIPVLQKEKSSGHVYLWWTLTLSHTDSLIVLSSVCSCIQEQFLPCLDEKKCAELLC